MSILGQNQSMWMKYDYQKLQGSLEKAGKNVLVFTNFQADNYGMSSGDDEKNCV